MPSWLWQLTSSDPAVRHEAMNNLGGSICHQGFICPATAYAVPFLIELLEAPTVEDKDEILDLLGWIASAEPIMNVKAWRVNPTFPDLVVPAHIPFLDAHEAVTQGVPTYCALLYDPNPKVRIEAANTLSCFRDLLGELFEDIRAILWEAFVFEENEGEGEGVRANLIIVLGDLSPHNQDACHEFLPYFEQLDNSLISFAAAIVITWLAKEHAPQEVAQALAGAAFNPPEALRAYDPLPWRDDESAQAFARGNLFHLGPQRLQFIIPELMRELAAMESFERLHSWQALLLPLYVLFAQEPQRMFLDLPATPLPPLPSSSLTPNQRAFLELMVKKLPIEEKAWRIYRNSDRLRAYGLPDTRQGLIEYLGDAP